MAPHIERSYSCPVSGRTLGASILTPYPHLSPGSRSLTDSGERVEPPIEALLRVRSFLGSSSFRSMPGAKMEKIKDEEPSSPFFYHFDRERGMEKVDKTDSSLPGSMASLDKES